VRTTVFDRIVNISWSRQQKLFAQMCRAFSQQQLNFLVRLSMHISALLWVKYLAVIGVLYKTNEMLLVIITDNVSIYRS